VSSALAQIPWPTLLSGGLVLLLLSVTGLFIRALLKGDLVPRSVLEDEKQRGDKWEAAWRESETRADMFDGRMTAIAEGTELNTSLLSQLVERARR
jgi:hypothetical protein